jgi:hypothetical protein
VSKIAILAKNLGGVLAKNSTVILTATACAGVLTTAILAVKATPRALKLYDNLMNDKTVDGRITKWTIVKACYKPYLPAVATGAATIACIVGSNHISTRRNAALAGVYSLTETAFKEYKEKVVETIGKNKELKVRDDISADAIKNNPVGQNEVIITGKGQVLCYDKLSGRYFKSDIEAIRKAVNVMNRELTQDLFVSVNELYYELGLADVEFGRMMGWDVDNGLIEITFSSQLTEDGEPCVVLNYTPQPRYVQHS